MTPTEWGEQFVVKHPEYKQLLDDPVNWDDSHNLMEHLFLGDVVIQISAAYRLDPTGARIQMTLDDLDIDYARGEEWLQNAIAVSFVESLGRRSPIVEILGPELRQVAREMLHVK
ncbi:DUF7674 family protein [Curtobacterium sp. MCLR17_031]|uniref:DUF7674 family protein n=1 Tax=Curtobacterium TaxID=2034 RepID=UPI0011B4D227|nr:hypothetical protein [Curtobacterium sp. MCLR17_031]WIE58078.1 hypothetical protein DEI96_000260 [Curtobacterium sp. MCLR17_031]